MIERLIITALVAGIALIAYRFAFARQQNRIHALADTDPLLSAIALDHPTIVYFTSPTCLPCKTVQQPALEQLQQDLQDIQVIKVDVTTDPDAARRWGVMTAPTTFILDRSGRPDAINYGSVDAQQLKTQISQAHAL